MSEQESNICAICGGVKRVYWTISFEECHPVDVRFDPASLASNWRLCPGHPEPATKHDGSLQPASRVYHDVDGLRRPVVRIDGEYQTGPEDTVELSPHQALSLLAWLKQEEPELERLAKEQASGE